MLVDPGSDDVVFPVGVAMGIGIDLSGAIKGSSQGVGGTVVPVLYAPSIMRLSDGFEVHRWRAVVAYTQAGLRFSLFGIAGGLEHFRTTLDLARREIEMVVQPSLPATQDPVP